MLPDICAKIETPTEELVGKRYANWWNKNLKVSYQYGDGPDDYVKGEEVYQLRCAYLHEGRDLQEKREEISAAIERFKFTISAHHLQKDESSVLLNMRRFCLDMCSRVEEWEEKVVHKDDSMQKRAEKLLNLYLSIQGVEGTIGVTGNVNPLQHRP
jgi:hypothetical protein